MKCTFATDLLHVGQGTALKCFSVTPSEPPVFARGWVEWHRFLFPVPRHGASAFLGPLALRISPLWLLLLIRLPCSSSTVQVMFFDMFSVSVSSVQRCS